MRLHVHLNPHLLHALQAVASWRELTILINSLFVVSVSGDIH
jgi:hypothetical protein